MYIIRNGPTTYVSNDDVEDFLTSDIKNAFVFIDKSEAERVCESLTILGWAGVHVESLNDRALIVQKINDLGILENELNLKKLSDDELEQLLKILKKL